MANVEPFKLCWIEDDSKSGLLGWSKVELRPIRQKSAGIQRFLFSFTEEELAVNAPSSEDASLATTTIPA
ncbi:MAG TPA: hypothetical protein EYG03_00705 [Planctomycetes bacterium]|nr:hypothetical protein [Fuerstiella sp.]HIK90500.1 hypothetical protein [Planctomycetota bacterium]